jgi:putative ABC transport system permease protein
LVQTTFTCLIGYGLGVGLATSVMILARLRMPDYAAQVTFTNLSLAFILVVIIAAFSSYVGVRKVLQIQPFDIFRG